MSHPDYQMFEFMRDVRAGISKICHKIDKLSEEVTFVREMDLGPTSSAPNRQPNCSSDAGLHDLAKVADVKDSVPDGAEAQDMEEGNDDKPDA